MRVILSILVLIQLIELTNAASIIVTQPKHVTNLQHQVVDIKKNKEISDSNKDDDDIDHFEDTKLVPLNSYSPLDADDDIGSKVVPDNDENNDEERRGRGSRRRRRRRNRRRNRKNKNRVENDNETDDFDPNNFANNGWQSGQSGHHGGRMSQTGLNDEAYYNQGNGLNDEAYYNDGNGLGNEQDSHERHEVGHEVGHDDHDEDLQEMDAKPEISNDDEDDNKPRVR